MSLLGKSNANPETTQWRSDAHVAYSRLLAKNCIARAITQLKHDKDVAGAAETDPISVDIWNFLDPVYEMAIRIVKLGLVLTWQMARVVLTGLTAFYAEFPAHVAVPEVIGTMYNAGSPTPYNGFAAVEYNPSESAGCPTEKILASLAGSR